MAGAVLVAVAMATLAGFGVLAAAQPAARASVLTLVASDGGLWALPDGRAPILLRRDVAQGSTVTALAWHPTRPELMLARLAWRSSDATREPWDTLVRLDLASGGEQALYPEVGPQARVLNPHYAADGAWAHAEIACCLAHELLVLERGDSRLTSANTFLPTAVREVTIAAPGPSAPDGRILMGVTCCMGPDLPEDPSGVYLVRRDLSGAERLTRGPPGNPIGLGPDGAWVASLRRDPGTMGPSTPALVVRDLPGGAERTLVAAGDLPLADTGGVAPDGTIAVATLQGDGFPTTLASVWAISPSGARREITAGAFLGFTAFAWAPADVVAALPAATN